MRAVGPERAVRAGGAAILVAGAAAYCHSLRGPFILDDLSSIPDNPTLRHLWPLAVPLRPPGGGLTVEGRPVLNLSLAVNHALAGNRVWAYHATNVAIHLIAGLVLFGVVRRTLVLALAWPPWRAAVGGWAAALWWTLHPLQTEAVTYIIQRAESLMGLFYLLALYGFIRGARESGGRAWLAVSVTSCLLGMATKEVMVSAPLVILAYDRCFVAGSWRGAWRGRRIYYGALAATWVLLALLVAEAGNRGGTSGLGSGVAAARYWLTQPGALVRYLRLTLWPTGQIFDYGTTWATPRPIFVLGLVLLAALGGASVAALARAEPARRFWGFLGLWFLAILAPTSLVPGNRQTLAEHRLYLALAPLAVGAAVATVSGPWGRRRFVPLGLALAVGAPLGWATFVRNRAYESRLALFATDAAGQPANPFAQANLGMALLGADQPAAAAACFQAALRLRPAYPVAEDNLGNALLRVGRLADAEACYRRALREDPEFAEAHNNLGSLLLAEGDLPAAQVEIQRALALKPEFTEAQNNLAGALARGGRLPEALGLYRRLLAAAPAFPEGHNDYGIALAQGGEPSRAEAEYRTALQLRPRFAEAHYNLANVLAAMDRLPEAVAEYRQALGLVPGYASAANNLGNALLREGRPAEAFDAYRAALSADPGQALSHYNLANALLQLGRREEAIAQYREAVRLQPGLAAARRMLQGLGALR
jgi:tetratricopeptide (TPR) repeat protein